MLVETQGLMAKAEVNYYTLLGVGRDATSEQIEASYQRLLKDAEDNVRGLLDNADLMYDLEDAYTTLMDPVLRKDHDCTSSDKHSNNSPWHVPMDKREIERLKKKREEMIETERKQVELVQSSVERGRANAPLNGTHKVRRRDSSKSRQLMLEEKKTEMDATFRDQQAKIREIKARAADRERPPPSVHVEPVELPPGPSANSIKLEVELEKRVAARTDGARKEELFQRQLIQEALDRGFSKAQLIGSYKVKPQHDLDLAKQKRQQKLAADCKAQWAHIKQIKARVASRERKYA
jgi:curved DNA-binding protein CbpA